MPWCYVSKMGNNSVRREAAEASGRLGKSLQKAVISGLGVMSRRWG